MISLKIGKNFEIKMNALPSGWVFYTLARDSALLYAGYTASLSTKLQSFKLRAEEDPLLHEFCQSTTVLQYQSCDTGIAALAAFKLQMQRVLPEYQQRIHPWATYVYLAIDARRFPFVSIQESTNEEWQYLGPFRSRYMLVDLIDSLSRILKLPFCETGSYPCDKFERDVCRGWCLALATTQESKHEHDLLKLDALLKEAFMHPNNGIYEMVQKQREAYFDDLEFAKADLLDDELRLLQSYRDWLNFLYVAKELSFQNETYEIAVGQLKMAVIEGKTHNFTIDNPDYRANEILALPLATVDEMKIIYDYIREQSHA